MEGLMETRKLTAALRYLVQQEDTTASPDNSGYSDCCSSAPQLLSLLKAGIWFIAGLVMAFSLAQLSTAATIF